jgi:hypothetical protein
MGLLKPATNSTAYAKLGIMGFAGSGKSFTAMKISSGLAKARGLKSVAYFDTEKGSDFLIPKYKEEGVDLLVHRGRAFADLLSIIKECEQEKIPTLVIDSISHIWRDLCDSYAEKAKRKRLHMGDWGILKGQWKLYTDAFLNSKVDIIMLGRAGYEYDMIENEETGKEEMRKTGTKMKVEGETGFEPDLLLEMERIEEKDRIVNRCWVVKDRSDTMNGKFFDYPTYKTFQTFWASLNMGGTHEGINTQRNSKDLFDDPDYSYEENRKRRDIALEDLQAVLIKLGLDGTSGDAKKGRVELLEFYFGTSAKTAIESMHPMTLQAKLHQIKIDKGLIKVDPDQELPL